MNTYSQPSNAAPGGQAAPPAPAAQTGAPSGPAHDGGAPQGGLGGGSGMMFVVMLLPILLLFLTMRGQNKKQKQLESSLKTGDTVVTTSGVIGKLIEVGETRVKVEIAPGVNVRMLKSAISGVDGGETKPADAKQEKPQEKKA